MERNPKVSVCCVTFNHENYIADAIESFLMQKTFFPFEILIHDDASTDRTPLIIREYEMRYPGLIKAVYQKENQYSRGERVSRFLLEKAEGRYIAMCEGDDYWTDSGKLQIQVEYMDAHPDCTLCVHSAAHVDKDSRSLKSKTRPARRSRRFYTGEVIEGGGGLFPTNSFFYPAIFATSRPEYYYKSPVGDYPLAIFLASQGYVYYMDRLMSAYRVGVEGSWSFCTLSSEKKMKEHFRRMEDMLESVNEETAHQYEEAIQRTIRFNNFRLLLMEGNLKDALSTGFRDCFRKLPLEKRAKICLQSYCPTAIEFIEKNKAKWSP